MKDFYKNSLNFPAMIVIGSMLKFVLFFTLAAVLFACSNSNSHWGYEGIESPGHWAELSKDYAPCQRGHHQSPIDLHRSEAQAIQQSLIVAYLPTHAHIINNGHSVEFDMEEENFIAVDDKRYQLKQLHFHADSEHTVNGRHFPAEMHLVHQSKEGALAVIALLIEVGDSNSYDHIFDVIPKPGESINVNLHLEKFIPENRERFIYTGSLTTPPCSENVYWLVFNDHIRVPAQQLRKFRAYYSHNYRPTQKTYNRQLFLAK